MALSLFFGYNGTKLADPQKILQGSGSSNRFVRLDGPDALERPELRALLAAAIATSKPMGELKGQLSVRAVSPTQRPRR